MDGLNDSDSSIDALEEYKEFDEINGCSPGESFKNPEVSLTGLSVSPASGGGVWSPKKRRELYKNKEGAKTSERLEEKGPN